MIRAFLSSGHFAHSCKLAFSIPVLLGCTALSAKDKSVQPGLVLNAKLNARLAAAKDATTREFFNSELRLPDNHLIFRHSGLGAEWNGSSPSHPTHATLNFLYNDKTRKMETDQIFAGIRLDKSWQADAGRMYPMLYTLLDNWPVTDLLTLSLKGDGKWHADGVRFTYTHNQWLGYLGIYDPSAYPGGVKKPMTVSAIAYNLRRKDPLQLYLNAGFVPDTSRSVANINNVLADNTLACNTGTACLSGDARWAMGGVLWQPDLKNYAVTLNIFAMARLESGYTTLMSNTELGDDYRGKISGFVAQAKIKSKIHPFQLSIKLDDIQVKNRFGESISSYLDLDPSAATHPRAATIKATWLAPHEIRPYIAVRHDRGDVIPLTSISLGLTWEWSKQAWPRPDKKSSTVPAESGPENTFHVRE